MIKEKQWFNIFIIIGIMFLVFFGKNEVVYADSISTKVEVSCSSYEMPEKNPYKYDDLDITDKMSFGLKSLGKLYVCGKDISQKSFNGIDAYGVSGNASLVYSFDQSVVNASDDKWHLVKDKTKKVNGKKLDSNILGGVMLIEKSYSGDNYVNVGSPICDYFNTNKSSNQICTIAGNDISKGVYYRITLAYKTGKKNKDFPWNTKYLRHVEKYDFYIVENSGIISIHNLSTDEELIKYKDYSQELLRHGETLEDNSVTRDGFEIESFASSYSVSVQKDNGKPVLIKSGERFTEDGKYKIKVRTKIGKEITKTVYVFKGSEDKGYSTYFGAGLVQAERVFRNDSVPTYARGGRIHIHKVDDSIPILYGTVKMVSDNKAIYSLDGTRSEQAVSLYPGEYIVDLYNGKGSITNSM